MTPGRVSACGAHTGLARFSVVGRGGGPVRGSAKDMSM